MFDFRSALHGLLKLDSGGQNRNLGGFAAARHIGVLMHRRLTVILSADLAGYSALMERDEAGALARLMAVRCGIVEPALAAHGGRVVKFMGDGVLAEFQSVVAAVSCAHDIQRKMAEAEPERPQSERVRYRIGINLGDVIVEDDDIYGDGVNIAARIQALAPAGGVAVSRTVRDQVVGKVAIEFEDMGAHDVKNIERAVHVFVVVDADACPQILDDRIAICVLPFANMSRDPEQEYFSDGVTEDIITDLSKVSSLAVTARNTAFAYKGRNVDIVQTARRLGVSHVLEGSVRKVGDRVRITAQLIDGATGRHLWAERYDRDLHDIFAVQDEIAEAITAALKVRLLPSEKQAIEHRSTTNPEAYRIFLMARQFAAAANARRHETVVRLCRRAVELDPSYARAWALLAIAQANMRVIVAHAGAEVGCDAAERALALDPDLAEAHAAKGRILAELGRYEEAWAEHRTAMRLDPDSYDVHAAAGRCAVAMRNWDDAVAALERAASLLEADFWASGMLIQCYEAKGDGERAQSAARRCLACAEKVIAAEPDHGSALGFGATALAALGDADRTREWAQRGLLLDPENLNLKYNLACGFIALGETERALDLLAPLIAVAQREGLRWFEKDNSLDPIRDHQRFKDMMANAEARHAAAQGGLHG